ncbi:MAG TPA: ABC transporter substrate-binding protein [Mycobacteriales bacterium]|nr:ABC transporter substrate-binding protein [Mycobacteriales bacterium]
MRLLLKVATGLLAVGITAAACAPAKDDSAAQKPSCAKGKLPTVSKGTLTIGTDNPAYPPWFVDDKPANGKGYESAVAYAVAKELGYPRSKVTWKVTTFNSVITPGPKKFDFDINQVSISADRAQAVDFSPGYYTVTQAVIALKSSPIAHATKVSQLKDAKLGAQISTTSYSTITDVIKPSKKPAAFNTNDLAKQALSNGQIDGLLVDLPTAFEMVSEIDHSKVVGQLPQTSGTPEQFGLVLEKDSPLTSCVGGAVGRLDAAGTLKKLQTKWLENSGAPVLK